MVTGIAGVFDTGISEKFETAQLVYSGARGKLIHVKNLQKSRKSRVTVPLSTFWVLICGEIKLVSSYFFLYLPCVQTNFIQILYII